jgi:hypothetical protein
MFTCISCHYPYPLDDVAVPLTSAGRCVCLACFTRQTGSARTMPKDLRRQLSAILGAADVAA